MAYYRKYRPQVIDEIDNANVREQLLSLLSKDRKELPHAYFFTGPKGTGKTTSARVIAKLFNCKKPTKSGPCGSCEECRAIASGTSLDVVEMDAASNRGIDEIRQLRDRIGLSPVSAAHTVYIIDEVHMLTTEAFNALLKTLEEPPEHAVFVLATTDAHKVPATIKSRCMEINFHRATAKELESALTRVATGEGLQADEVAIRLIASAADGSFRDAVKILEQASLKSKNVTEQIVTSIIPTLGHEKLGHFLEPLIAKNAAISLDYISRLVENGFDLRSFLLILLQTLETELISLVKGTKEKPLIPRDDLERLIRIFSTAYEEMRFSPIAQLPIELAIIDYCVPRIDGMQKQPAEPVKEHAKKETAPEGQQEEPKEKKETKEHKEPEKKETHVDTSSTYQSFGLLSYEKLVEHWPDFIIAMKPYNHSVAGVLRSSRPKSVSDGIVTIEAFYKFHQEKLADMKTKQTLADVLKKLFGEKVKVEIVLGKK